MVDVADSISLESGATEWACVVSTRTCLLADTNTATSESLSSSSSPEVALVMRTESVLIQPSVSTVHSHPTFLGDVLALCSLTVCSLSFLSLDAIVLVLATHGLARFGKILRVVTARPFRNIAVVINQIEVRHGR